MVTVSELRRDILDFIKSDLSESIDDPKLRTRTKTSKFIMTSYPKRKVIYPLVTLKIANIEAERAGMQTVAMDIIIELEVRVWALDEKTKDEISTKILDRLRSIQFTALGSIENSLHDFGILSSVEIPEDGETGIKSNVTTYVYRFYNVN